jgi:hypothetical protein
VEILQQQRQKYIAWHLANLPHQISIGRITATPLYINAEKWRLDIPETSVYPATI